MDLSPKCPRQEHSPHSSALPQCFPHPTHQLRVGLGQGLSITGTLTEGTKLGKAGADGVAATGAGEAQKLRLSRASESWLMSRQYGSRCRMKSTL